MAMKTDTMIKDDFAPRVFIGMSGGVDSSVSALLLQDQGYEVIGVTVDTGFGIAPEAAAQVCGELKIEHRIIDLKQEFRRHIVDSFIADYAAGLTPSPCLICNPLIKFAALCGQCERQDDMIATGHYVQKHYDRESNMPYLTCGYQAKDQSYFLALLSREQISRCLFPLADMNKPEVRRLAGERGLCSAARRDSFDVCFILNNDYRSFLRDNGIEDRPGEIVDTEGNRLGKHKGLFNYTIGQRRGLDVPLGYPAYVLALDGANNRLVIGPRDMLYRSEAVLSGCVYQSIPKPDAELRCLVRVRHKATLSSATLIPQPDETAILRFDQPEWGITPGQYAAFYDGERLLGGGRFQR
ncbi:MAG: tRNA 2-thiouridine(34) synthase MnmA [Oscillospiraceae bacterium]|nr:tRNA 2-thiouridine(34) synthase MnmA [Oscillospiraceae bacterium]